MAEHFLRQFGDITFPVDATDVANNQLFSAFDPGRDQLLSLFSTAISVELGGDPAAVEANSAWANARSGTKLSAALPVAQTLYEAPRRSILRETAESYPLLALYRTTSEHDEYTLAQDRIVQNWGLEYILGPLDKADYRRLGGAFNAVRTIIHLTVRQKGHPAFEFGTVQFGPGKGQFSTIRIVDDTEGPATYGQEDEGLEFHALAMRLQTSELDGHVAGEAVDFEGATVTLGVGDDREVAPDVVVSRTEVPRQPPLGVPEAE